MRRLVTLSVLLPILLLAGCATVLDEDGALAVAPYRIAPNGQIVVEVRVNDQPPLDFAIDTAASISVLNDDARADLALDLLPGQQVAIQGMFSAGRFPLVKIDKLTIGREVVLDTRLAALPTETDAFRDIDGILGVDIMKRYAIGFSARENVVRLYPPELVSARSYVGWRAIQLRPEYFGNSSAAVYVFDVEIRGRRIPALLDLGAGFNLMSTVTARRLDYRPKKPRPKEEMSGAIASTPDYGRLQVREMSAGSVRWEDVAFTVLEVELFDELKFGFSPRVILGSGLFTKQDFIIDFARRRLLVRISQSSG